MFLFSKFVSTRQTFLALCWQKMIVLNLGKHIMDFIVSERESKLDQIICH
jgi:hypothetical protein